MNKAPTGPYLAETGQAKDDKCWWCGSGVAQTREHLFKYCRRWKDQQAIMWRDIRKETEGKRTVRNTSIAQLIGDERCTAAILEFLQTTEVGMRGRCRRAGSEDPGGGLETGSEGTGGLSEDEGESTGRAGTGKESVPSEGAESRPGSRCNEFPLFLFIRGRVVGSRWGGLISWSRPGGGELWIYAMAAKRPNAI
jgi:hypothetical protein